LIVATAGPLSAQPTTNKKPLTFADFGNWRSTSGVTLSRNGEYLAYVVGSENNDGEAVVRHVASGKEFRFPPANGTAYGGGAPQFTPDSKRVLLPQTPTKAALKKAKDDKAKAEDTPKNGLALVDLASGKEIDRIADVGVARVAGEGSGFLIYRHQSPPKEDAGAPAAKGKGGGKGKIPLAGKTDTARDGSTDLLIRDLTGTSDRVLEEVSEYSLSDDEKTLVYVVSSKTDRKNGVYAMNPRFGTAATPVKAGPGRYSNLTWDEKQSRLAFFFDDSRVPAAHVAPPPHLPGGSVAVPAPLPPAPAVPSRWRVLVWDRYSKADPTGLTRAPAVPAGAGLATVVTPVVAASAPSGPPPALMEVLGPDAPGIKKGWELSEKALSFSLDGTKLYVATAPERGPAPPADDVQLDIWHWKDSEIQPMQRVRAPIDRNRTFGGVVLLDTKKFRQLSDDGVSVSEPETGDWAIASDNRKYRPTLGFVWPLPADYSFVNVRSGESKPVLTGTTFGPSLSPHGKYLLGFDGKDWFTVSVPDGKRVNLTAKLKVKFFDEEHDTPDAPSSYGGGQWTADGKFVLVSDRFDIWKLAVDGSSAENLTQVGRGLNVRFSILRPRSPEDRRPERTIDLTKPLLLGAVNLVTRDTGFYRLEPGASPKLLLMGSRWYGAPIKAKDADVYLLSVQTFSQAPDLYVTTPDFHELKRVTEINPQAKNFNWGTAELIKYASADGIPLQGVLIKPENFDPSKKYPMVVYIYERLSQNLHQFRVPAAGTVMNPTFYASNGYLVLMPDIAYTVGAPGQSSLKCVLPAIQAVADKGFLDEGAIGIQGHSWGGYQIAYMVTQTGRFKAACAGAPVSNMTSAYSGIRWGSGLPRQFQYEQGQSRIGASPWEAPMKYIENSPVFMADRVKTPLLMLHNDRDDAVPWYQGIEYFLALRRLGKEVYLLNYNNEFHGLREKATQRDYTVRMFQFFEHHLKGKPAPDWMTKGVPFLDREKDKEQIKKLFGPGK
jgi:dienelactone hydrolase